MDENLHGLSTLRRMKPLPGIIIMGHHHTHREKPSLSLHQKKIRFFIVLFVVICTLFAIAFFWLVSRLNF
jgi:hypothetical protein